TEDAVALLRAWIGRRTEAEPEAAVALAEQCVRLPLALRVAAALAAVHPGASLSELVSELGAEHRWLELPDADGDAGRAVRGVFSWSYHQLPADAARLFRMIGVHPGPDLDPHAAAILSDISLQRARYLLELLAREHLIQRSGCGRYGTHELLRAY